MDPISGISGALPAISPSTVKPTGPSGFGSALSKALENISAQQQQAANLQQRFQLNDPGVSLEETVLSMQTANLSFQALVQVRNRVVAAYQDIMNMQV